MSDPLFLKYKTKNQNGNVKEKKNNKKKQQTPKLFMKHDRSCPKLIE